MKSTRLISLLLVICGLGLPALASAAPEIGDTFSDSLRSGGEGPPMVVIPDGMFVLGGGAPGQQDLGMIKIQYLLAFSATEITNAQYRQFLEATRSGNLKRFRGKADKLPVAGISWDEAEAYVTWLSRERRRFVWRMAHMPRNSTTPAKPIASSRSIKAESISRRLRRTVEAAAKSTSASPRAAPNMPPSKRSVPLNPVLSTSRPSR